MPVRPRHQRRPLAWTIGLLVVLTSCNGAGPLDVEQEPGWLCTPVGPTRQVTVGLDTLTNSGSGDVRIDDVELVSPTSGLALTDAMIVPVGSDLVGVHLGYPPAADELPDGVLWGRGVPAGQARIPAGDVPVWNLVVGLALDESVDSATTEGFAVEYEYLGQKYRYRTPNRVTLEARPCQPPDE
ncbi:MAG TPA: hypothetical protein VID03_07205 [Acidimicrobiia bacterium]|jgi:hypothetical protein